MVCSPLHYPVNLGQPCELPLKPPRPDKRGSDRKNQSFRTGPRVVRNVIIKAIEQMMMGGTLLSTSSKWELIPICAYSTPPTKTELVVI